MVHAAINHFLSLYLSFPNLSFNQCVLRNTGNRSLKAIHGTFGGDTCSLPIASPNLSFREFLEKMNKMLQIHTAEHNLKQVKGHSIVSSRKKRKTFSKNQSEVEDNFSILSGSSSYQDFQSKLMEACMHGDKDSKDLIEKIAPKMAAFLKKKSKWDSKEIMHASENVLLAKSKDDVTNLTTDNGIFQQLIQLKLGPVVHVHEAEGEIVTNCEGPITNDSYDTDATQALANMLLDVSPTTEPTTTLIGRPQLVRALQPQREVPNKDRGKRFAAGTLQGNECLIIEHDLHEFHFWAFLPTGSYFRGRKFFILGQILLLLVGDKPVSSCLLSAAPAETQVVLRVYKYDVQSMLYSIDGLTSLLKANCLKCNVTEYITLQNDLISFNTEACANLIEYMPYHSDITLIYFAV